MAQIGESAEGVVFDLVHKSEGVDEGNTTYPIIRFVTRNGEWITEQNSTSSLFVKKEKKVEVLYNPENPKEFVADLGMPSNLILPSFLLIGLALIAFGIYNSYATKIIELLTT